MGKTSKEYKVLTFLIDDLIRKDFMDGLTINCPRCGDYVNLDFKYIMINKKLKIATECFRGICCCGMKFGKDNAYPFVR